MKSSAPLSKEQYGIYVECMKHSQEVCYNMPYLYILDGKLDGERLKNAVETAVLAHPTLFTRIEQAEGGEPRQIIDSDETFCLEVENITDINVEKQAMTVPFDLLQDRLFHIRLLRDNEHYYLLLDIHHIISDGTSRGLLLADIEKAYNGEALEREEISLAELATAEADLRSTQAFEDDKRWYAANFDCGDCYSPLLPDKDGTEPSEAIMTRKMSVEQKRVDRFCKEHGIFRSTFFTAVYSFLLAKFNNEHEALFSTIHNGRSDKRLLHTVGMTVRTLPVYAKFSDETTVADFIREGQEQMTGCRNHEAYAYSDAVSDLSLQCATLFAWHGTLFAGELFCGKPMRQCRLNNNTRECPLYVKAYIKDNSYYVEAEYSAADYSAELISQYLESYEAVAEGFLKYGRLGEISIATPAQVEQLDSFNRNTVDYDDTQTIVSLFRRQAKATPDNIAVVYMDRKFTYKDVDNISDRIAGYIVSKGLGREDVVSVLINRSEWMPIASLGVLKAGCAYQPLDPSYPAERLNFMMQDANAKFLIADEELRGIVDQYTGEVLLTKDIAAICRDTDMSEKRNAAITPDSLFILLYTSGSTGVPKGCQLTHGNLVAFCHWYQRFYDLHPEHRVAAYASYGFDACMMDMYPALTCGAAVHIIPEEIRLDLIALNDYFEQNGITHSFMTTQVCYQFATSIDNHSLRHLSAGGEKLPSLTPPSGYSFYNGYGPTECTIFTTCFHVSEKLKDVPIGKPLDNMHLYIVDPQGKRLPVGAAGELWVSGPQVGRGYLNRPEKTAEVYIPNPFVQPQAEKSQSYSRCYRTGDIVRYLPDGNIQFVGRRDGQVKIRGFRIELKEVESVIREFPGIKDATVQAFDEEGGGKFIAAYIVSNEKVDIEALNNFILDRKPPYMVPAVTMQIDAIPLNQNQKVNKRALPKPEQGTRNKEQGLDANVPMNVLEQELHEIIAGIVGNKDFGVTTILGYAGLTSISAIKLAVQMNKKYGVKLDSKSLVKSGTIQTIEEAISNQQNAGAEEAKGKSAVPTGPALLTHAQTGVYIECVNNPTSTTYNIPMKVGFPAGTDSAALEKALEEVIKAHPLFFAHFSDENEDIVHVFEPDMKIIIPKKQMSEEELEKYKYDFVKPFDLHKGPLFRTEIVTTTERVYLLVDIHHLISDGGSFDIFFRQLCSAMNGEAVEPEDLSFAAFSNEEREAEQGAEYAEARDFFQARLANCEGATEIQPDLSNTNDRGEVSEVFANFDFDAVNTFCREHIITPAHLTLSAVLYTLSRFSNSDNLCITTVSNGRSDLRIRNTIGMFVNTLALSSTIGEQSVMDFIRETSENFDNTLSHENYPFAQIAADYNLTAEIMFAYQLGVISDYECCGGKLEIEELEYNVPKFRTTFFIQEHDGKPSVCVFYNDGRYSRDFMQSVVDSVSNAIEEFMRQPDVPLKTISLVSEKQTAVLDSFNRTTVDYDDTQTIVSLFRRQAKATPDNIAVVYMDRKFTYKDVDETSDRIAGYIVSKGLGREDVVSVLINRSEWMPIASLGVLKAGCAYQPLDPSYPAERLNFMMQDANAKFLIADEELRGIVDQYTGEVLLTKDIAAICRDTGMSENLNAAITPDSLFILLYTSGSTGVPKGCQLTHGNLVAFCHWYQRAFALTPESRLAAYASYGFDANMMDTYPALTCGAAIHIIPEEIRLDLIALNDYFEQNGITHSFMTTQVGYQFATSIENHSLSYISMGGEKLAPIAPPKGKHLLNLYGPTESTVLVTAYEVTHREEDIPIGKAIDNMRLYIVDPQGHRLPVGAPGELWISGPQVSRGYLNRPDKTAEVYIQNPFVNPQAENGRKVYNRCYRTGDIVRYLPDGNIQFVGRRDGQVKIRGFRIELKEVESVIREFPGIKDATVQAFDEEGGGKFIAAYIVSNEKVDIEALNNFILDRKPPYMVPAVTMQIDAIPLNQNQKVNKRALPKPEQGTRNKEQGLDANVPMNMLEQELHDIIAGIVNNDAFGVTTILSYAGMTSLSAIKLAVQIKKRYGVTLDSKSLVKKGTIQSIENEILEHILHARQQDVSEHDAVKPNAPTRLTYAQTGVYVECMKNPTSTIYNVPFKIGFPADTDTQALAKAVETIIKAHPQFSAHFGNEDSNIVQIYDPAQEVNIPISKMSGEELDKFIHEFVQPFNLSKGPLYRTAIVTAPDHVYLFIDVHHLMFDGGSFDIFLHQLCDLLSGGQIEEEDLSYAAFAQQEKDAESGKEYASAREYFQSRLGTCDGPTEIQSDLANPIEHGTISEVSSVFDLNAVEEFCREHNFTAAHLTLAAVFYTLSKFSNNDKLCITTISNGRSNLSIRNTVGMFVNTLALSATIGEQSVLDFISETSENFYNTLEHENYPFAQIAADFDLTAEIMFAYQLGVISAYKYHGKELDIESLELDIPKFSISFYIKDDGGVPSVSVEYDNGRYSREMMQSLADSVCNVIAAFVSKPDAALQSVSLLDDKQVSLLDSFNQNDVEYDNTQTIVSLFRKQAELTADNVAVVYHDVCLTYRQVDEISDGIAAKILSIIGSENPTTETVVSVLIPRCELMVTASLGVLKTGCAYQPLDPSYPAERLNFMMQDANARLLIADKELLDDSITFAGPILFTNELYKNGSEGAEQPLREAVLRRESSISMKDLFILLYTSGSTGIPKGCQLTHGNLVAFCHWYHRYYNITPESRVAAYASYGFDACMMDMYPALTSGASVYIIGEDIRLNLPDLNDYFEANHITHSFMTTQVGYQFATSIDNHSLRYLSMGGEKLAAIEPPKGMHLVNLYGPTESTVLVTAYEVTHKQNEIPIGKAIDNMHLYIVDKQFNRLPVGAVGELWVSGPQVSRGYLNRPDKTAEVYIQNPFVDVHAENPKSKAYNRCYRTGDIVRYLADGNIQFVGRSDGQVKIRGFRIELKEVEAVIRQYEGIKDATVQAFDYENGGKFIAAYIVSDKIIDIKDLNAFISRQKPPYMVPAATMQIDAIPLNQNQKVNRKALPAPVIQVSDRQYVEPKNEHEKLFAGIFSEILSMDKIGALDNFFDLGGTSLMVTRVVIAADKAGLHVAYGDVFANPTPRQLAQFVAGDTDNDGSEKLNEFDYTAINDLLQRNTLQAFMSGDRQRLGNVLLTGATGFLGIHVLKELIDSDAEEIWCLVRGKSDADAEARLKTLLFYYFDSPYIGQMGSRLHVVAGDVTSDMKSQLPDCHIDTVFNCAANVKHFSKGTDIEDVNIGGAEHCVDFCLQTGARLVHVSTTSVGGLSVNGVPSADTVLTERDLYFGQYLGNQYMYSKFMADRLILDAVASRGLSAKIMRVGNLAARSTDGEFQVNFKSNSYMGRIKAFNMLGCCAYDMYDEPAEFSPINETARAVVLLASTPKDCTVFHPYNNHTQLMGDILTQLGKITGNIRFVEGDEFESILNEAKNDPQKAKMLSSILAYQDMAHGQQAEEVGRNNDYTSQVLHRLGFYWSTTSWDYDQRMLRAIAGFDFFE